MVVLMADAMVGMKAVVMVVVMVVLWVSKVL